MKRFPTLQARYRGLRRRGHNWLVGHPRLWRMLYVTGCLRGGVESAARGVSVGLFVGLTPTVGFQTIFMIIGCVIVRGNFPAAFAVSWLSNPITMAPLYWGFHELGELLTVLLPVSLDLIPSWMFENVGDTMTFTAIGSLIVATPFAVGGYFATHGVSRWIRLRRRLRRERRDEAAPGS
ncbi:DUF2062 domain-containing protein [Salicola sp. Rm-C-2C1-2]|uniref:DUF2062 domain-containing protein n=1 Tax=Salicola sp. Rm-C-2C1-2 TaxID=3141321 RepID=UPI0032E4E2EE